MQVSLAQNAWSIVPLQQVPSICRATSHSHPNTASPPLWPDPPPGCPFRGTSAAGQAPAALQASAWGTGSCTPLVSTGTPAGSAWPGPGRNGCCTCSTMGEGQQLGRDGEQGCQPEPRLAVRGINRKGMLQRESFITAPERSERACNEMQSHLGGRRAPWHQLLCYCSLWKLTGQPWVWASSVCAI